MFTRLESGGYLWVRRSDVNGPPGSYFALYVSAFDPATPLDLRSSVPGAHRGGPGGGGCKRRRNSGHPQRHSLSDTASALQVLIGTGGSGFQPPVDYGIASSLNIRSIAVADLNGDHKPDAVISSSGKISAFSGNGDGTFQPERTLFTSSDYFAAGDCRPQRRWQARSSLYQPWTSG